MAKTPRPFTVDGEDFLELSSGEIVSISELVRIYQSVSNQVRPGMSGQQVLDLISETIQRMRPN